MGGTEWAGAGKMDGGSRIGYAGIRLAAILSALVGGAVWLGRDVIVRAYTPNEAIIAVALPLFLFIAVYQLFDAIQVTTAFVLRAYKIAVVPTLMYAIALWGIGLGGGYTLGLDPFGWSPAALRGAAGFWLGNSVSLALVAAGFLWYLRVVQRKALKTSYANA